MKRLRHWLFNFAAAVSLILGIGTSVLWYQSYSKSYLRLTAHRDVVHITAVYPGYLIHRKLLNRSAGADRSTFDMMPPAGPNSVVAMSRGTRVFRFAGFVIARKDERDPPLLPPDPSREFTTIVIPFRWLALLSAILPMMWIALRLSRQPAMQAGHCQVCGYDLRATPEDCSRYPLNYACPGCSGRGH